VRTSATRRLPPFTADDVQLLDRVLADAPVSPRSRGWLLKRAALGVGVAAAATPFARVGRAFGAATADTPTDVGVTAATAEALAVTYLTQLIGTLGSGLGPALDPLKAANQAEQDHYAFLTGAGFQPLTKQFWIPDAAFVAANIAPTIEALETIFVNAYLIGATVFATGSNATLARYAAEIAGVEAEHRTLARQLQGKLPDNLAYESYAVKTLGEIVGQIQALGVGFGAQGSAAGKFYTYNGTTASTVLTLDTNAPDETVPFTVPTLVAAPKPKPKPRKKPKPKPKSGSAGKHRARPPHSMPKGTPKVTG
jgi:hypothetical protein